MDAALRAPAPAPLSTYRLQFGGDFGFSDARRIVDYLYQLGVGAVYASPYLRADSGSTHGYGVVDYGTLNPEIGSVEEYRAFVQAAQGMGIGQILDVVPNHMAIGAGNAWWDDVLRWGEGSRFAKYFDIDWRAGSDLDGKVLLPFLDDSYASVIERGEIVPLLDTTSGTLSFEYRNRRYPLSPHSYAPLLRRVAENADAGIHEMLHGLADAYDRVQDGGNAYAAFDDLCRRLAALATSRGVRLGTLSPAHVDALLGRQHYRLAYWRSAAHEINYRRFFDVNELAALRVEDDEVFEATHGLIFDLIGDGSVQGLRIDHIDGLADPASYCRHLSERAEGRMRPQYLVVEKILSPLEELPDTWPVDGTTGYEFLNASNALFVDHRSLAGFDRIYRDVAACAESFDEVTYRAKHEVLRTQLAAELSSVTRAFLHIAQAGRQTREYTYDALRDALAEVVACFPVYRTYVTRDDVCENDRRSVATAIAAVEKRGRVLDDGILAFIEGVLTLGLDDAPFRKRDDVLIAATKFQQLTPAVMAKAVEDTALYRYVRLLSLNDVGGDPSRFGMSVAAFHTHNRDVARRHPGTMRATATHDHKRGEDARLRISALSEMPVRWRRAVHAFEKHACGGSADERYALYQTLLGTWPAPWGDSPPPDGLAAYLERIERWLRKAMREAKVHTSWTHPQPAYEDATVANLHRMFSPQALPEFMGIFAPLARDVAMTGMISSLAQTTLKCTVPGVPDIYQGCELWDLSLVDPDNRTAVDFERRKSLLHEMHVRIEGGDRLELAQELLRSWPDGRVKLFVLWQLLQLRKRHAAAVRSGGYHPLTCHGERGDRIVAYARGGVVVVVPRLVHPLVRVHDEGVPGVAFGDEFVRLPRHCAARYVNVFTGEYVGMHREPHPRLRAAEVFACFPVAVLEPAE